MVNDDLGKRMKTFYEQISQTKLVRRMPVAIRIDGKAFHTFTKGFQKPFDPVLMKAMQRTMKYLCENIQGCVLGYTQSDEITLILIDYQSLSTDVWFDYKVQKMCSISASMATMAFNKFFWDEVWKWKCHSEPINDTGENVDEFLEQEAVYRIACEKGAMFDSRSFNIPKEEVTNLIYWRQLDATRNSIQMVGQSYFSHKELHGKSCNDIQDMLHEQKGINWNDYSIPEKRGTCCIKQVDLIDEYGQVVKPEDIKSYSLEEIRKFTTDSHWKIDTDIPIFKGLDRFYIDRFINVGNVWEVD